MVTVMALTTYYTNIFTMGKVTPSDIPYRLNAIGLGDKYDADKNLIDMLCSYASQLKASPSKWPRPVTNNKGELAKLFYRQLDRKMHDMFMLIVHSVLMDEMPDWELTPDYFEEVIIYLYRRLYYWAIMDVKTETVSLDEFIRYSVELTKNIGDLGAVIFKDLSLS